MSRDKKPNGSTWHPQSALVTASLCYQLISVLAQRLFQDGSPLQVTK